MKNNKGFTLIELIAVVTIIGVLSTSAIVGISRNIDNNHKTYCSENGELMKIAARDYFNDNRTKLPTEVGAESCVSLETLENEEYIEKMVDYADNVCDGAKSSVCAVKQTNTKYYYRKTLE